MWHVLGGNRFGSGALMAVPFSEWLFTKYRKLPELLGNKSDMAIVQDGGRLLTDVQGQLKEVVVATADTLGTMPGLVENGVYLTGTGATGVGPTFLTLSAL
jgi:ribose 5-phosphate isomerase